jgi:hypothetical protein
VQTPALATFARILAEVRARENARRSVAETTPVGEAVAGPPGPSERRLCPICGADLDAIDAEAENPNGERVYCSSPCRQKAWRQRQRAATA